MINPMLLKSDSHSNHLTPLRSANNNNSYLVNTSLPTDNNSNNKKCIISPTLSDHHSFSPPYAIQRLSEEASISLIPSQDYRFSPNERKDNPSNFATYSITNLPCPEQNRDPMSSRSTAEFLFDTFTDPSDQFTNSTDHSTNIQSPYPSLINAATVNATASTVSSNTLGEPLSVDRGDTKTFETSGEPENVSSFSEEDGNAASMSHSTENGAIPQKTQRVRKRQRKGPSYVPSYLDKDTPCVVCGDLATGFHYKAMTCEGCKGFFRRSHHRDLVKKYQCTKGGTCIINIATRHECQYCRYQKCIAMKMCPGMVMSPLQREQKRRLVAKNREKKRQQIQAGNIVQIKDVEMSKSVTTPLDSVPTISNSLADMSVTRKTKENSYIPGSVENGCNSTISLFRSASQGPSSAFSPDSHVNQIPLTLRRKSDDISGYMTVRNGNFHKTISLASIQQIACGKDPYHRSDSSGLVSPANTTLPDSGLRKLMSGDISVFDEVIPSYGSVTTTEPYSNSSTGSLPPKVQPNPLAERKISLPCKEDEELVKQIFTAYFLKDELLDGELENQSEWITLTEKITNYELIGMVIKNDSVELAQLENFQLLTPDSFRQMSEYFYPMVVRNARFLKRIPILRDFSQEDQDVLLTASFRESMFLHMLTNYDATEGIFYLNNGMAITHSMATEHDCLRDLQLVYHTAVKFHHACDNDSCCFAMMLCQLALESDRLHVKNYEQLRRQQTRNLAAFQSYVCSLGEKTYGSTNSYSCFQRWTDILMVLNEVRFLAAKYPLRCLSSEMEKVVNFISRRALTINNGYLVRSPSSGGTGVTHAGYNMDTLSHSASDPNLMQQ